MTDIAATVDDLTPDSFSRALGEAGTVGGARVVAAEPEVAGTGQMGLVARAKLTYEDPHAAGPASLIVKLASPDEGSRTIGRQGE